MGRLAVKKTAVCPTHHRDGQNDEGGGRGTKKKKIIFFFYYYYFKIRTHTGAEEKKSGRGRFGPPLRCAWICSIFINKNGGSRRIYYPA
jgi:hypothetical protein